MWFRSPLAILVVLFSVQRMGTGWIGRIFGPFMLVWFAVLGLLGICGILAAPGVLAAINPTYAISYHPEHGSEHDPGRSGGRVPGRHGR